MKTNKGWVTPVLVMLTIWCLWNSVKINSASIVKIEDLRNVQNVLSEEVRGINIDLNKIKGNVKEVKSKLNGIENNVNSFKEEINDAFNKLSFGSAWREMYDAYGEGHVFDWNGGLYTTNMKEGEQPWQQ